MNGVNSNRKKSILLVEDEMALRSLFAIYLRDSDVNLEIASCAEEAYEVMGDNPNPFDLAILDIMLPGVDGWELARDIQGVQGEEATKILFISARYSLEDGGPPIPNASFLRKPFSGPDFVDKVLELLQSELLVMQG